MSVNFSSNFSHSKKAIFLTLFLTLTFFASAISTRAAGELDAAFAGGGITPAPAPNSFAAVSVAVQPDGKIVAGGTYSPSGSFQDSRFALVRYLPSGLIDTTFGANGLAITAFGEFNASSLKLNDIALLPNGKIVAVGSGRVPYLSSPSSRVSLFVARYNSDGTLDTSSGGKYTSSAGGFTTEAEAVAVQADGKFIVAGHGGGQLDGNPVPDKILLIRFADSGIDATFGSNGTV
ncbi:MAG: delta-60 repeat domain-containing protein, partial [Acidobacteriota bacterium]|nr:delta-60 repeat domain-containing protein [Acidobacteriota bacterium]